MFQHLVVAIDGSENSLKALDYALVMAEHLNAALDIISVEETLPPYVSKEPETDAAHREASGYFGKLHLEAIRKATRRGIAATSQVLVGHELGAIVEYLRAARADLLIIGARGHSAIWNAFLGGTADQLVAHAPTSILVIHSGSIVQAPKEIAVGLDGSPSSMQALTIALELARAFVGIVHGISVTEEPKRSNHSADPGWDAYVASIHARATATAESAGVHFDVRTVRGHAGEALIKAAADLNVDLLIVGATGLQRPWNATTSATARTVSSQAQCSVLVVRFTANARTARDIMSRPVTSVRPDAPLKQAIDLLFRRGVKALPVVDSDDHVVGLVTGGDLLKRAGLELRLSLHGDLRPDELARLIAQVGRAARTVESVMTPDLRTVSEDTPIEDVAREMTTHGIKRLPVIDENGRLRGIVSRTDLLRLLAANGETLERDVRIQANARTVADVTVRDVATVKPTSQMEDVLELLVRSPMRRVVVIDDDRKVVGIITDRSLVARLDVDTRQRVLARLSGRYVSVFSASNEPMTAASVMEKDVYAIESTASLRDVLQELLDRKVKRLVVVDEQRHLMGMIDRGQIMGALVRLADEVVADPNVDASPDDRQSKS